MSKGLRAFLSGVESNPLFASFEGAWDLFRPVNHHTAPICDEKCLNKAYWHNWVSHALLCHRCFVNRKARSKAWSRYYSTR